MFIHFLTVGHKKIYVLQCVYFYNFLLVDLHRLEMGLVVLRCKENAHYIIQN